MCETHCIFHDWLLTHLSYKLSVSLSILAKPFDRNLLALYPFLVIVFVKSFSIFHHALHDLVFVHILAQPSFSLDHFLDVLHVFLAGLGPQI